MSGFDGQKDGSNAFIYSRFLVPYLQSFSGWAIFCDGDMVCNGDIAELWDMRQSVYGDKAVSVVKHDYSTKHPRKYIGTPMETVNEDYPRKNWSSVMLWNCGYYYNRILTPEYVSQSPGSLLHRFQWLKDEQIGELPTEWNHLVSEYPHGPAKIYHYTLGVSGIKYYADVSASWQWHKMLLSALTVQGEDQSQMVIRAKERIGDVQ